MTTTMIPLRWKREKAENENGRKEEEEEGEEGKKRPATPFSLSFYLLFFSIPSPFFLLLYFSRSLVRLLACCVCV